MKLLLLSNSTNLNEPYLEYCIAHINLFLGKEPLHILFIPYAAVTFSYNDYEQKVNEKFSEIGHRVISIHHSDDPRVSIANADAIIVGGGNTFQLLKKLQDLSVLKSLKEKVLKGTPYIGWSAGSNLACPSIATTNDMPIVETTGLKSLDLIPFQINPHYSNFIQPGHGGETRDQRIFEFLTANPSKTVVGLPEGCMLKFENYRLQCIGDKKIKIFKANQQPFELDGSDNLEFLLMN